MSNNNKQNPNQSKSMFLYTALIFAVALILIILAFFGQTNLSALRKSTAQLPEITEQAAPAAEEKTASADDEAIAKMTNTISALDSENNQLKKEVTTYDNLLEANSYISKGDKDNADAILSSVDESTLTENQKILYDQIKKQINE